jgi:hypothetical protein
LQLLVPRRSPPGAQFCGFSYGSPAIPRPVENKGVGSTPYEGDFHGRASGIVGPRAVIEIEILGDRKWRQILSADGVRTDVAPLSRKALQ